MVLGISPDDGASHRAFAAKHDLPFILLCDPEKKLMCAWGAFGKKLMYGKETVGVIRSSVWIGPDGTVKRYWKKVPDAAAHPARVLEALTST